MSPKVRPTIIKSRFSLAVDTTTDLKILPINRTGNLVAVNIIPFGSFADMFVGVELSYTGQRALQSVFRGYLKKSSSVFWAGRIPTDTETELILEFLNAAGENITLEISAVIAND